MRNIILAAGLSGIALGAYVPTNVQRDESNTILSSDITYEPGSEFYYRPFVTIEVGTPPVKLNCGLDATSASTYIFKNENTGYNPDQSTTATKTDKTQTLYNLNYMYGNVTSAPYSGPIYQDVITIDGQQVKDVPVAYIDSPLKYSFECALGLAPSASDAPYSTLVRQFHEQGLTRSNIFTLHQQGAPHAPGTLDIGGSKRKLGKHQRIPVVLDGSAVHAVEANASTLGWFINDVELSNNGSLYGKLPALVDALQTNNLAPIGVLDDIFKQKTMVDRHAISLSNMTCYAYRYVSDAGAKDTISFTAPGFKYQSENWLEYMTSYMTSSVFGCPIDYIVFGSGFIQAYDAVTFDADARAIHTYMGIARQPVSRVYYPGEAQ